MAADTITPVRGLAGETAPSSPWDAPAIRIVGTTPGVWGAGLAASNLQQEAAETRASCSEAPPKSQTAQSDAPEGCIGQWRSSAVRGAPRPSIKAPSAVTAVMARFTPPYPLSSWPVEPRPA